MLAHSMILLEVVILFLFCWGGSLLLLPLIDECFLGHDLESLLVAISCMRNIATSIFVKIRLQSAQKYTDTKRGEGEEGEQVNLQRESASGPTLHRSGRCWLAVPLFEICRPGL